MRYSESFKSGVDQRIYNKLAGDNHQIVVARCSTEIKDIPDPRPESRVMIDPEQLAEV
jgi:hypothetical protein